MKILADSNILFAKEAFGSLGEIALADGREITHDRLDGVDVLLVRSVTQVNRELLENTRVRFVASATIGTDHIDLAYLQANSIGFAHAPGSNANAVAEYVAAALFTLAKKKKLTLSGLTVGIIGVGNVGQRVLALCRSLGMQCLMNDPPKKALTGSDSYLPIADVLAAADVVTVHVPFTTGGPDATVRMVDAAFIASMKKGAVLINTSRGGVLDENSLSQARARLGGLVLDVWNNEPKPNAGTIAACDIATPHIAGYSYDGKSCGTQMIYDAACAFFFKEKTWHAPDAAGEKMQLGDKIKDDALSDVVLAAYPIMEDDRRFRKILDKDASVQGAFFDELRRTYPKRLEFRNYTVSLGKKTDTAIVSALVNLGFKISLI
jgi:erythronate-4-phosphate dehydrogenase